MAMPTFVGSGSLEATETAATPITPGYHGDVIASDVLFLVVWTNNDCTFDVPTDWTAIEAINTSFISHRWYWRRSAAGISDTPPTITSSGTAISATNGFFGRIYAFRGAKTTDPPYEDWTATATASTTPATASVDSTIANSLIVSLLIVDDDNTWSSGMPPAGWTNAGPRDFSALGADAMSDAITIPKVTAGNEPAVTIGTMSASDVWVARTFALNPGPTNVSLLQSTETDLAQAFSKIKYKALAQVEEIDTANSLIASKLILLSQVTESDSAQILTPYSATVIILEQTTETDIANNLTPALIRLLDQAIETDAALTLTVNNIVIYIFSPPTQSGARYQGNPLSDHLGSVRQGITIWRDATGTWHEMFDGKPYGESDLFANRTEFFQGGREYILTDQQRTDLIAAGYGAYIVES